MKEKDFQSIFGRWLVENKPKTSAVFELKLEKGKSIRFDAVRPHQIANLTAIKFGEGHYYKITDSPITMFGDKMRFTAQKPYDCQFLCNMNAYIVVLFYVPRKPKEAIFICPSKWVKAQKEYAEFGRMSIKEVELRELGEVYLIK